MFGGVSSCLEWVRVDSVWITFLEVEQNKDEFSRWKIWWGLFGSTMPLPVSCRGFWVG
jgi:hypothetical protein